MSDARAEALKLLYPEGGLPPIEEHLDALSNPYELDGVAVGLCTLRIDEAGPPIQALIERAARGEALSDGEGWLLFRGLHILGGARFAPAFPALLDLLRLADPILDVLLGDVVTEGLAKIAAGMFDDDVEALLSAIEDVDRDEYVRDALLGAATFLTWDGRIERGRFEAFLRDFYEASKAPDGEHVWCGWQEAVALLGLRSLRAQVEAAFASERVDPQSTDLEHFLTDLAEAERSPDDRKRFEFDNLGYIEDVLAELERWPPLDPGGDEDGPNVEDWERIEPVRNLYRDVGRNDPCPCGSGKKFKKCCLGL